MTESCPAHNRDEDVHFILDRFAQYHADWNPIITIPSFEANQGGNVLS